VVDLADELVEASAVLLQLGQAEGPDTAEGKAVAHVSGKISETADKLRAMIEGLRQPKIANDPDVA